MECTCAIEIQRLGATQSSEIKVELQLVAASVKTNEFGDVHVRVMHTVRCLY